MLNLTNIKDHRITSVKLRLGEIQLVARDGGALIDLQSRGYDSMGREYRQHAYGAMNVEELLALRDALTRILAAKSREQVAA
jgi:hypothetical protein